MNPVFLDTETTGLGEKDEICELAIIDTDGSVLLETYVKPTISIPASATHLHGIKDADVANALGFAEVWPTQLMILHGRAVVIYNAEYDTRMFYQSAAARCMPAFDLPFRSYCAMDLYAKFYGEWNERRLSYAWQSLTKAALQCRIDPCGKFHRARADADTARRLLMCMAEAQ